MKRRTPLTALLAIGATLMAVRLWPSLSRRAIGEFRWRRSRAGRYLRGRIEGRVSIVADMGRPPHQSIIWSGLASEAEAVRAKLPEEFGHTWVVRER